MAKKVFYDNLTDNEWLELVDWAIERSDRLKLTYSPHSTLLLVPRFRIIRPGIGDIAIFSDIRAFLIDENETFVRWGSKQRKAVIHFTYELNENVAGLVRKAGYLENWVAHDYMPEDPTFLLGDKPILESISHEGEVFLFIPEGEKDPIPNHENTRIDEYD